MATPPSGDAPDPPPRSAPAGAPAPSGGAPPPAGRNPWYLRAFFGPEPLPPAALQTLWLVALGLFFENYDIGLISAALPQIAEDLGIQAETSGYYLSVIRMGGIGTFFLVAFADRLGRRRVFLASLVGMSIGTFGTALTQTPLQFAILQMATRVAMLTAAALAIVILAEELPPDRRGAGLGFLTVLGGTGIGLGAGLYAAVDVLPFGWRALYAVGLVPVFLLPMFRRSLRETRHFEALGRQSVSLSGALRDWLVPLRELMRTHPGRVLAVGGAGLLSAAGSIGFFQYTSFFLQRVHGWTPGRYALLLVGGGIIALMGTVLGGRGSDRFGRRVVGGAVLLLAPVFVAGFYLGPESTLVLTWGFAALCIAAGDLVIRTVSTELFPTSHRSTAGGWLIFVMTLGWSLGLLGVGVYTDDLEQLAPAIAGVSVAVALAAVCLLFIPETRSRELAGLEEEF